MRGRRRVSWRTRSVSVSAAGSSSWPAGLHRNVGLTRQRLLQGVYEVYERSMAGAPGNGDVVKWRDDEGPRARDLRLVAQRREPRPGAAVQGTRHAHRPG
jgi:hypothetical protein